MLNKCTLYKDYIYRDGIPSVRPVLMKSFGSDGFQFYTNYGSRKAQEIEQNPNVALTFFWEPLRRTVRKLIQKSFVFVKRKIFRSE